MGQRIIISESEINHIRKLYETAPPPSESVLVANKNPFKYTEYVLAKRFYDKTLKDGDLFFTYGPEFNTYIKDEINSSFIGKTIRFNFNNTDNILTMEKLNYFSLKKLDGKVGTQCLSDVSFYSTLNDDRVYKRQVTFKYNSPNKFSVDYYPYTVGSKNSVVKLVNEQSFLNTLFNITSWTKIPDEYFQIRKIQRQQTDF